MEIYRTIWWRNRFIKAANYTLNPYLDVYNMTKIGIIFNGGCLKPFPATILHGGLVNVYIVYEISNKKL